ncbi:uncharacterized protein LOC110724791 [Chenopodium quinoa]|uniref:uncharacterized protein LOC110724791 n=1 Tax=Chenopodium quinoa TaxID=63459 RepID=UPI000B7902F6|nr:uncharacterized protein LOC110724791 [Chenopodium quinoa]
METPSSSNRRITRSQAIALANSETSNNNNKTSKKIEESEKSISKSRQRTKKQDRSVLIDITNDSPIVGLASGSLNGTPISSFSKQRRSNACKKTPGSGEALLRGQVKNLLQKVEEEAEISKFCLENCGPVRNAGFKAIFNSPAGLVAPTPVNTPQVLNFSAFEEIDLLSSVSEPPIEDQLKLPLVVSGKIDEKKQEENETDCEKDVMISRALFLEFSDKSDCSSDCSSVVTYQVKSEASQDKLDSFDDDAASVWSIQVNASTRGDDEDEDEVNQDVDEVAENDEYYDEEEGEAEKVPFLDELCDGISNMSMEGEKKGPKFMGKHKRFVYNSDDELVEEFEEFDSTEALRLKGLPTPKGKHVRFLDEE